MLKIAICDDSSAQLKASEKIILEKAAALLPEIDLFTSGGALLNSVSKSDYVPDIAILDIDMPDLSGIDTAKELNRLCPGCTVIFLTAFLSYALDVYETRHFYFILKSQLSERILPVLTKAVAQIDSACRLEIKEFGGTYVLSASELVYMERYLKKTLITDASGRLYTTYQKPEELLSNIKSDNIIKVHQSYYVNLAHVKSMKGSEFTMSSGQVIPISRSRYKAVKESFHRYIFAEDKDRI